MDRNDMAELVILNTRVDQMGQRIRKVQPVIGELLLEAGDLMFQAGKLIDGVLYDGPEDELYACSDCGNTVEDGECVCANDPAFD